MVNMRVLFVLTLAACATTPVPKVHEYTHAGYDKVETETRALSGANYYCSGFDQRAEVVSMTTSQSIPGVEGKVLLGYFGPT